MFPSLPQKGAFRFQSPPSSVSHSPRLTTPSSRFPNGTPMERDSRFQSLLFHISRSPNKQVFLIKQNFTFLLMSPVKDPPSMVLQRGPCGECSVPKSNGLFIYSFIRISESPVKEMSRETGGKHMVTVNGAPRGQKAFIKWGAAWFPNRILYHTAVTTPEPCRVHFQASQCGNCSGQEGTPIGLLQALLCSPDISSQQCFILQFHSPLTSAVQITKGGTVCSGIYS